MFIKQPLMRFVNAESAVILEAFKCLTINQLIPDWREMWLAMEVQGQKLISSPKNSQNCSQYTLSVPWWKECFEIHETWRNFQK